MRKRSRLEGSRQVVEVGTEKEPLQSRLAMFASRGVAHLTMPARTGIAARTMATKAKVMTNGGLDAESLKMWWISVFLP